jgi:mono/diheme cytochrome c family protein
MITSCSDSPESQTSTPAVSTDTVAEVMRPDPVLGEAVFANNCASCHAEGLDRPGTMNLTDKYDAERGPLANRDDLSAEYVKVIVRNGLRLMPAFRPTEITDRQLDDLAAYLSTAKPLSATSSAATP